MKLRDLALIVLLSLLIVIGLDWMTNSLDLQKNSWDFFYYIPMAKDGFQARPMVSPFAYRFATTLLVHALTWFGVSIENGFRAVAYLGAVAQLTGIFFFVVWLTGSRKGAFIALGVTALSLYNVKFLLFDMYRPDHLAYALILLQTWLAFQKKFPVLLLVSVIAIQVREFNAVPLMAYIFMRWRDENQAGVKKEAAQAVIALGLAIGLPRLLIPVTENYQIVGLSAEGIRNALLLPFMPSVDVNFLFVIAAYFLPLLFLADWKTIHATFQTLPRTQQRYLMAYALLVLFLTVLGGTDFARFATFLFLPQIILIGLIAPQASNLQNALMFISMFIFNLIWMPFPDWNVEQYRDFYGGFSLRLNRSTFERIVECLGFIALGALVRKWQKSQIQA